MQHEAAPALTAVAPEGVDTLVLTAAVLLRALIFVWGSTEDTRLVTVSFQDWQLAAEPTCFSGLTWEILRFKALFGNGVVWFELDAHVVVLGGDGFWFLRSTELPV